MIFNQRIGPYAARTPVRNFWTSTLRRVLSLDSIWAAERTCPDAAPVSPAPRLTSLMLCATSPDRWAASWTLRAISCVAAPYYHLAGGSWRCEVLSFNQRDLLQWRLFLSGIRRTEM